LVLVLIGHFVFGPEPGDGREVAQTTSPSEAGQATTTETEADTKVDSEERWNCLYNVKNPFTGDDAFGSRLSASRINSMMNGIQEPVFKWYGVLILICPVFLCFAAFHWIGDVDPALEEEYGAEGVSLLLYNGYVRPVVGGMPDWAFASIWWMVCSTVCGVGAAYTWGTDAIDDEADTKAGAITDPVEMKKVTSASTVDTGVTL